MKVIEHSLAAQTITYLPDEILDLIASYICHSRPQRFAQRDLWACCLISKDWYASTVKYLYASPLLSSRNFDKFARTVSPPISSRARRVGLEDFVQCLNMGSLAYESKKSTTSRLISRTKTSLSTFVAPAVSFSTTSLAPLSKCANLQVLDLSRDTYDFGFTQLVRSIKSLEKLVWLSLPKDCICQGANPDGRAFVTKADDVWPFNLTFLQFNESRYRPTATVWSTILSSLPPALDSLAFRNCASYDTFDAIAQSGVIVPQVTSLSIGVQQCDDTYYFDHLTKPFPNVRKVAVPGMTRWVLMNTISFSHDHAWPMTATEPADLVRPPQSMEYLILEESPDFPATNSITLALLDRLIKMYPNLFRIDLPESYLELDDEVEGDGSASGLQQPDLDELNETLVRRAIRLLHGTKTKPIVKGAGIFMTKDTTRTGVGMKRSFRYRGDRGNA